MMIRLVALLGTIFLASAASAEPVELGQDCETCPELVQIPAGSFEMGDSTGVGFRNEVPVHTVTFATSFAIGKYEVTFDEWDACHADGGCSHNPADNGFGRGNRPVINVNWFDTQEYVAWLSEKTGKTYRLPTEAEWEYAARAGTATNYFWGDDVGANNANCMGCGSEWEGEGTAPAGSFQANDFGLYDVHGNAHEWVEDCYATTVTEVTYEGLPTDGSAAPESVGCYRVIRGGSWNDEPRRIRSADRSWLRNYIRNGLVGFRIAREETE